jgi:hypothetical protein
MGNRGMKMAALIMIAIPLRGRGYGDAKRQFYESVIRIILIYEKNWYRGLCLLPIRELNCDR